MPQKPPTLGIGTIDFECPDCATQLRIKEIYAHLPGRCPECSWMIRPLRAESVMAELVTTDADGLIAIEDEWPEPAEVVARNTQTEYEFNEPVQVTRPAKTPVSEEMDILTLAEAEAASHSGAGKVLTEEETYIVDDPHGPPKSEPPVPLEDILRYHADRIDPEPVYTPMPRYPLVTGIYGFLLEPKNLVVLLLTSVAYVAFFAIALVIPVLFVFMLPGLGFLIAIAGSYASAYFLAVLDTSAAGNEPIAWPRQGWKDMLGDLFYVSWILVICVILPFWGLYQFDTPPMLIALIIAIALPVGILSSDNSGEWWNLIEPLLIVQLLKKPLALLLLLVHSSIISSAVVLAPALMFGSGRIELVPVAAIVWAAAPLLYARVLGRVVYVLQGGPKSREFEERERPTEIVPPF